MSNEPDIYDPKNAYRVTTLPPDYAPEGKVRIYRERRDGGIVVDTLEFLYTDGWGKPFWGPVPIVEAP
jgi:hypothetical protein